VQLFQTLCVSDRQFKNFSGKELLQNFCLRQISLFFLVLCLLAPQIYADNTGSRDLLETITEAALTAPCPSSYLEIHLTAASEEEAGLAIVKLFWLVDSEFVKGLVNTDLTGIEVGVFLGETFRRYCEQKPVVSVDVAVKQSVVYMEWKNETYN